MSVLSAYTTKDWLVEGWLAGVALKTRDGLDRPASFWTRSLRSSIAEVERRLSLSFAPVTKVNEPHDATDWSPVSYYLERLHFGPVQSVTSVKVYNGNVFLYEIPPSRYHIADDIHRQVQLVPSLEAITLIGPTFLDAGVAGPYSPGRLRYTYTAGMEAPLTGTVSVVEGSTALTGVGTAFLTELVEGDLVRVGPAGESRQIIALVSDTVAVVERAWSTTAVGQVATRARIPDDLLELIGLNAAVRSLDQIGVARHEAGVASESISDDGFSESISYRTSGRGGAYEGTVIGYIEQMKGLWKGLARTYAVRLVGVI